MEGKLKIIEWKGEQICKGARGDYIGSSYAYNPTLGGVQPHIVLRTPYSPVECRATESFGCIGFIPYWTGSRLELARLGRLYA